MSAPVAPTGRRSSRAAVLVAVALVSALVGAAVAVLVMTRSGSGPGAAPGQPSSQPPPLVVAAGDIACEPGDDVDEDSCQHGATADAIAALDPAAVLPLGDLQYPEGELEDFEESYDPTWGRFKDITHPVIGNHEASDSGGDGYFAYFGEAAGERGWYSFDLGAWHLVALNSECRNCLDEGSEQLEWLEADLAASDARCTLAYLHRPRFSTDEEHGDDEDVTPVWEVLDAAGADVVLAGHAHAYERFAPLTADGEPDDEGLRSFVVGTGGVGLYDLDDPKESTEARQNDTFGVLALTLRPEGYDWEFVRAAGGDFEDAGSADCTEA